MRISDWSSDVCSSDLLTVDGKSLPFGRGFLGIYGLQDINLTFVEADAFTADAYHAAASKAVRMAAEGTPWHLALVQTERDSRQLAPQKNPYLVAKAAFLSNQIPTQSVSFERSEEHTSELQSLMPNAY